MADKKNITKIIIIDDRACIGKDRRLDEGYRGLAYCLKQAFAGLKEIHVYPFRGDNVVKSEDKEGTEVIESGQSKRGQTAGSKLESFKVSNVEVCVKNQKISKQVEANKEKDSIFTLSDVVLKSVEEEANKEKDSTLILLDVVLTSANDEEEKEQAIKTSINLYKSLKKEYKVLSYTSGKKDKTVKSCLGEEYYYSVLDITWYDPRHFAGSVKYMYENLFKSVNVEGN